MVALDGGGRRPPVRPRRAAGLGEEVDSSGVDPDVVALQAVVGLPLTDSQLALDADLPAFLDVVGDGFGRCSPGDHGDPLDVVIGAVDGGGDLADRRPAVGVAQFGLATDSIPGAP
jgi:hypothetical protein